MLFNCLSTSIAEFPGSTSIDRGDHRRPQKWNIRDFLKYFPRFLMMCAWHNQIINRSIRRTIESLNFWVRKHYNQFEQTPLSVFSATLKVEAAIAKLPGVPLELPGADSKAKCMVIGDYWTSQLSWMTRERRILPEKHFTAPRMIDTGIEAQ